MSLTKDTFVMKQRKVAVAGSGGGFKGNFIVGILSYLFEKQMQVHYFAGVSTSALIAVMCAQGKFLVAKQLYDMAAQDAGIIYKSDLITFENGKMGLNKKNAMRKLIPKMNPLQTAKFLAQLLTEKGREKILHDLVSRVDGIVAIADNTPLLKLLIENIDMDGFLYTPECVGVSLTTGEAIKFKPEQFNSKEQYAFAVWSSATMPMVWAPVPRIELADGTVYTNVVDGGLDRNSPVSDAVDYINEYGTDDEDWTILVLNCGTGYIAPMTGKLNLINIGIRSLYDITLSKMSQKDLDAFLEVNHRVLSNDTPQYNRKGKLLRDFDTVIIQPDDHSIGDTLDSSPAMMTKRYQLGRAKAQAAYEWAKPKGLL